MWHDEAPEAVKINSSASGEWASSELRNSLNTTFLEELKAADPAIMSKLIQVVNKGESKTVSGALSQFADSQDYVWLASASQVFGVIDVDPSTLIGAAGSGASVFKNQKIDSRGGRQLQLFSTLSAKDIIEYFRPYCVETSNAWNDPEYNSWLRSSDVTRSNAYMTVSVKSTTMDNLQADIANTWSFSYAPFIKVKAHSLGDEVTFAGKKWLVADMDSEGVTLMWHDEAPAAAYYNNGTSNNDWSNSTLQKTLNTTFLDGLKAEDTNIMDKIIQVTNAGETYSENKVDYQQRPESKDYVWLASISQVFGIVGADGDGLGKAGSGAMVPQANLFDTRGGEQFSLFQGKTAAEIKEYFRLYSSVNAHETGSWLRSPECTSTERARTIAFAGNIDIQVDNTSSWLFGYAPFIKVKAENVLMLDNII